MSDVKFVNGLFVKESDQDWIVAKLGINVDEFIDWLKKQEAEKGFVNITIAKSKKGNIYAKLDDYKPTENTSNEAEYKDDLPFSLLLPLALSLFSQII